MRTGGFRIARVMKYVVLVLTIAFVVVLMIYASGSSRPFKEVEDAVSRSLDKSNLTLQDGAAFKREFGLSEADYAGVMYYASEFSISAEEVLVVLVKDESQVQEVTEAIDKQVEARKNDFDGYAPEEVKLLEDAKQSVRGRYIFFAAAPKAEEYLEAFSSSL
jgi:hypothetical protein